MAGRGPGEDPPGVQSDYLQQAGHGGRQNPRPGRQGGPPTSSSVSLISESQVRGQNLLGKLISSQQPHLFLGDA